MGKVKYAGKRIIAWILTVCTVLTMMPQMQVKAAATTSINDANVTVQLWNGDSLVTATTYTYTGSAITPAVVVKYNGGSLTAGVDYAVSFSDNVNSGTATVTIKGMGSYGDSRQATFRINKVALDSVFVNYSDDRVKDQDTSPYMFYDNGNALTPGIQVQGMKNGKVYSLTQNDYSVSYENNTIVSGTPATVKVELKSDSNYTCAYTPVTRSFDIYYDMSKVTLAPESQKALDSMVYSGGKVVPDSLTVIGCNSETLRDNTDYIVRDGWSESVEAGDTSYTIFSNTGNSGCKYRGNKTFTATIKQYDIKNATIKLDQDQYLFTGIGDKKQDMTSHVSVYIPGNDTPVSSDNYTVAYDTTADSNGQIGNNWLTITGKNNLTGTADVQFQIVQGIQSAEIANKSHEYDGKQVTEADLGITVTDASGDPVSADNYDVAFYSDKECTKTVTDAIKVGTYYVQITGTGDYTGTLSGEDYKFEIVRQSSEKCVFTLEYVGETTRKISLAADKIVSEPYVADGIHVRVTGGEDASHVALTPGEDQDYIYAVYADEACTVKLEKNVTGQYYVLPNAGTYYVKITLTGNGNYEAGELKYQFKVTPKQLSAADLNIEIKDRLYTGSTITPDAKDITIQYKSGSTDITLKSDDYEIVSVKNAVDIWQKDGDGPKPTVEIRLKGNYTLGTDATGKEETVEGYFRILPKAINNCACNLVPGFEIYDSSQLSRVYSGEKQLPNIVIMDGSRTLIWGTDYEVMYVDQSGTRIDPCEAGKYTLTITGKGNYASTSSSDNIVVTYTIEPKSVDDMSLIVYDAKYNNGISIDPETIDICLTDGDYELKRGTDYQVEGFYSDKECKDEIAELKVSGLVYVKVKGIGNYTGTRVASFYIGEDFSKKVTNFDVSGWTYDVDENGNAVSYYDEIDKAINQKLLQQNTEIKGNYKITYFSDSARTLRIDANSNQFSSAGTIYYQIDGTGNYYGAVTGSAVIAKKSLSKLSAEVVGDYIYSGSAQDVTYYDGTRGVKIYSYTSEDGSIQHELETSAYIVKNGNAFTAAGEYTLVLSAAENGNYEGTKTVSFTIQPKEISTLAGLKVEIPPVGYTDKPQTPVVKLTYGTNATTLSANSYKVEVYKDKDFTQKATEEDRTKVGILYVKVIGTGNYTGFIATSQYQSINPATGTVEGSNAFEIKAKDISNVKVSIEGQNYVYTNDHKLVFTVTQEYPMSGGTYTEVLELNKDYTYQFDKEPVSFIVGEQAITLTGTGNYTGKRTVMFYYAGDISDPAHATIVIGDNDAVKKDFTGSQISLKDDEIKIKAADTKVLENNKDYTVTYRDNTEPGTATAVITGINDNHWVGTVEKQFTIIGDLSTPYTEISIPDQVYTGSAYNTTTQPVQGVVVRFHGRQLTEGVDYKIISVEDAANVTVGGATLTIKAVEGGYFTGQATQKFSVKYGSSDLDVTLDQSSWEYNDGKEIKPAVTVRYRTGGTDENPVYDSSIAAGTDYIVSYHNNTAVGKANGTQGPYVMVTPVAGGKITGDSRVIPFTINKVDISRCVIQGVEDSYLYTGSMIKPETLKVYKKDGTTLIDPSNYEISYRSSNPANPSMALAGCTETITVTGKGNYTGSKSVQFAIKERDLNTQAECSIEDQVYSAAPLTPEVVFTITDENGKKKTLTNGTDFVVEEYRNNTNAAEKDAANAPYAVIRGIGSCSGNVTKAFTIKKRSMEDLVYSQVEDPQYVPGKLQYCPEVAVYLSATDEDSKLAEGIAYHAYYYNNIAVLDADGVSGPYIQFEPADTINYEGSHQIFFSILAKDIESADIKVSLSDTLDSGFDSKNRNYVYDKNKTEYTPMPTVSYDDGSTKVSLADGDYTFSYESNKGIGTGYVVITGRGNYTGERREAFTIGTLISNDTVTITGVQDVLYNGQDTTPTDLKVKFNAKNEYLKEQTETEKGDYTVGYYLDPACQVKASLSNMQNAGRIYVAVTGTADESAGGYVGSAVVSYEIMKKSLTAADITVVGNDDVDYTGSPVYPANLQVIDNTTGHVLDPSSYQVKYENNVEIGTASATITASETGNYKDSITVYYRVTKHSINNTVAEAIPDQKYTGNYIIPNLTIYDNGKRLVRGVDYEVVNGNNLRAGESWVIIQGLGNYDQTKRVYFNIVASLETAIVDDIPDQLYTGSPVTPVERVACGGNTLVRDVDYTVSYANNTEVGDASITIRPLTRYYNGTIVKKFTITNSLAGAEVTGIPASYRYTGEAFMPEPVVRFNGITLTKNVDYTVVYRNNVNVGTASVIISGMGKYSGTKIVNFTITQKDVTSCTIYMVESQNFTGKLITPPVVVKDGNKVLTQGVDYVLSYSNNLDVGTGYITIAGRGDYQGTVTRQFRIVAQEPVGNVLVQNKNEAEGTFDVLIDGTAVYVDNVRIVVWSREDRSDAHSYTAQRVDGDTFIAYVNASNHGYNSGSYQIEVFASGQNYEERSARQTSTVFQPMTPEEKKPAGTWKVSSKGWWYEYEDGGYVSSAWLELDGTWYYFDPSGYMVSDWQYINGSWYYFGNDGCMRTGWQKVGDTWYYMKSSGAMATGWNLIDGQWYYMNGSGAMLTGWQLIGGTWYYMKDSGAMVTGWIKSGSTWYYMKDSGAMATGWQLIGGTWYYMYPSGAMATNTWIGRDYVSRSGAWTASR